MTLECRHVLAVAYGGECEMMKSVLAVSEGGPDAVMSFKLAARVAAEFEGAVDALHLPVVHWIRKREGVGAVAE